MPIRPAFEAAVRKGRSQYRRVLALPGTHANAFADRRYAMKTYEGERTLRGIKVTVDGAPLPPRMDLRCFNKTGFEWTYAGPGPQQLALALLADHLGDDAAALARSEGFMRHVVAYLDNAWCLTSADIDEALAEMG
jgi:hypothetical protein